ncbi:MAG: TetR/AcrR family transcriptional regulator [Candidatus Velthaea sp.]
MARKAKPESSKATAKRPASDVRTRREALFDTAVELIRKQGYRGTTLRDIAKEFGVTEPAVYYYFDTKEALLFTIYEETLTVALATARDIAESDAAPADKLRAVISQFAHLVVENKMFAIFFREKDELSRENWLKITRSERDFVATVARVVEEGVARGVFRPADPVVVTFGILGMAAWINRGYRPDGGRTLDEIVETYDALILGGSQVHAAST